MNLVEIGVVSKKLEEVDITIQNLLETIEEIKKALEKINTPEISIPKNPKILFIEEIETITNPPQKWMKLNL